MSKKNPTKFENKGMELWRNGEHIATRTENDVLMQPDCEKFSMIAVKMLNSKAFNKEHGLESIEVEKPKEEPVTETVSENKTVEQEVIMDNKIPEDDSDDDYSELDFLREQNRKLQEQIDAINQKQKQSARFPDDFKPEPIVVEAPIVESVKHDFSPWPDVEPKAGVPPCPQLGECGTKDPAVREWLEQYYPDKAKEKYASFYHKRKFLLAKEEKRAKEKALADEERKRIFG